MKRTATAGRALAALAAACACAGAQAAGGHHGVDDASILARGACEQETWASRAQGGERLVHAGLNCGVGPVELAGAGEYARADDGSATGWALEVKWAHELAEGFAVGLDLQPRWAAHQRPRHAATRFAALATWNVTQELALHANAGLDFVRSDRDLPNGGVAMEWAPVPRWSFVLERFLDSETHFVRAGARWAAGRRWTIDFSHAHRLSGAIPSTWTLGLGFALGGD